MYEAVRLHGKVVGILRLEDGATIPLHVGNRDYRAFLEWQAVQPTPIDISDKPVPRTRTQAAVLADLQALKSADQKKLLDRWHLEQLADFIVSQPDYANDFGISGVE